MILQLSEHVNLSAGNLATTFAHCQFVKKSCLAVKFFCYYCFVKNCINDTKSLIFVIHILFQQFYLGTHGTDIKDNYSKCFKSNTVLSRNLGVAAFDSANNAS